MGLLEKIEFLNELCDDTLAITKFIEWEVSSFGRGTLLSIEMCEPRPRGKNVEIAIDKAVEVVLKKLNLERGKND